VPGKKRANIRLVMVRRNMAWILPGKNRANFRLDGLQPKRLCDRVGIIVSFLKRALLGIKVVIVSFLKTPAPDNRLSCNVDSPCVSWQ